MKIANKITLLIIFLSCVLGGSTWFGLRQIAHIRSELSAMINYDMVLMEAVTSVHQLQLQKNILLQQLIGIAEELGFEQTTFARGSYLRDQLKNIRQGINQYLQEGAKESQRAREAASGALRMTVSDDQRSELGGMVEGLERLEAARQAYHASLEQLLNAVEAGGFQLSLEDLENLQRQENGLSKDVQELLVWVQKFSRGSLTRSGQWEAQSQQTLVLCLWLSVLIGMILAIWIVRSIVRPLDRLSRAAVQIGKGDFNVQLDVSSHDELARLSETFNTMSRQLEEFKRRLEEQNASLKETNAELDRFIQFIGHEIANPLTMMVGYCAYLEQHAAATLDPKSQEALQGLRKSTVRMHQMVKELLEFNKAKRLTSPK